MTKKKALPADFDQFISGNDLVNLNIQQIMGSSVIAPGEQQIWREAFFNDIEFILDR